MKHTLNCEINTQVSGHHKHCSCECHVPALRARLEAMEGLLKEAKDCIDDMAFFAHDVDITDAQALAKIKVRWLELPVVAIAEALKAGNSAGPDLMVEGKGS